MCFVPFIKDTLFNVTLRVSLFSDVKGDALCSTTFPDLPETGNSNNDSFLNTKAQGCTAQLTEMSETSKRCPPPQS